MPNVLLHNSQTNDALDSVLNPEKSTDDILPIYDVLPQICQNLREKPNIIIEAPPGAGKTTVVPLALLREQWNDGDENNNRGWNRIIVVEPRRVATRSAALRMSGLIQERVGHTIGYAIRGERRLSRQHTKITVVTDGILLQKLRQDPELIGIEAVVFDEFHERGIGSDTALALCREVQSNLRPELRLVVMSATLLGNNDDDDSTSSKLCRTLGDCNVLKSEGRKFPVDIKWANQLDWRSTQYLPLGRLMNDRKALAEVMCKAIEQGIINAPSKGDILAFLPGAAEIRLVVKLLEERCKEIDIVPLYGALSKEKQDIAIFPKAIKNNKYTRQRVIVSSPIAEASLTLPGVTCVVDSGLRREPRFDVDTGMPRLVTRRCSRASAIQRAGRAGRVQEGLCLRIYNEIEFEDQFLEHSPPEIYSTDLIPTLLLLLDWGYSSIDEIQKDLPFVDSPDKESLQKAMQILVDLGAVRAENEKKMIITDFGKEIAKIPSHPRFATCIVQVLEEPTALAAAVGVAFIMDNEVVIRGPNNINPDISLRINDLYAGKFGKSLADGLLQYASRIGKEAKLAVQVALDGVIPSSEVANNVSRALLPGFVDLVAECKGDASYGGSTYLLSLGRSARLDGIRNGGGFIIVLDTSTGDDGIARIRSFISTNKELIMKFAVQRDLIFTVPSRGHEVRAKRVTVVGSLELASTPLPAPSADQITSALKKTIRSSGGVYTALVQALSPEKRERIDGLRNRIRLAAKQQQDYGNSAGSDWPACFNALDSRGCASAEENALLENTVEPWLAAAGSLKKIDMYEILVSTLSPEQKLSLDSWYPVRITAPDGSQIPVLYSENKNPTAIAKLQQFFGQTTTPMLGPPGKNPLPITLSLLSPGGKELAQTVDLPFFWKETYPMIRAEMRGRYAKHPWPEDPLNAIATRKTKKQLLKITTDTKEDSGSSKMTDRRKKRRRRKR